MFSRSLLRQAAPISARCVRPVTGFTSSLVKAAAPTTVSRLPTLRSTAALIHTHDSKRGAAPSAGPTASNASNEDIFTRWVKCGESYVCRLQKASTAERMHMSSQALIVLAPAAWLFSPSFLNFPVDLALGLVVPFHSHVGLETVAVDYVPKEYRKLSIGALYLLTAITVFGLLKVNLCGPGITESVKSLWKRPRMKEDVTADKKAAAKKH